MERTEAAIPETVDELLEALGGAPYLRQRLDVSKSNTSNWRKHGRIPARHYRSFRRISEEKAARDGVRVVVSEALFSFDELQEQPQEAAE